MKKFLCTALAVALMLLTTAPALAGARMPENRGAVTDDANVLSAETVRDIEKYAELAEDDTNVNIHVVVVHFLDGMEVKTYARQLFSQWGLGDDDLLLLGAAGEDSFATVLGEDVERRLGAKNAENLMYTSSSFGDLFKAQQYDAAFANWFTAANTLLNKQYDENMKLRGLFAAAQDMPRADEAVPQSATEMVSEIWTKTLSAIDEQAAEYEREKESRHQEDNGIGVGGWIVLAIIVMIIFSQSDPVRKARNQGRGRYRNYGCGCSPLGWILTLFGVNAIIDKIRGGR